MVKIPDWRDGMKAPIGFPNRSAEEIIETNVVPKRYNPESHGGSWFEPATVVMEASNEGKFVHAEAFDKVVTELRFELRKVMKERDNWKKAAELLESANYPTGLVKSVEVPSQAGYADELENFEICIQAKADLKSLSLEERKAVLQEYNARKQGLLRYGEGLPKESIQYIGHGDYYVVSPKYAEYKEHKEEADLDKRGRKSRGYF